MFARFTARKSLQRTISLARQIASRSQEAVLHRARDLVFEMDVHEARGYVRARAAKIIRREASAVGAVREQLSNDERQLLTRITTERVVQLVMGEVTATAASRHRLAA